MIQRLHESFVLACAVALLVAVLSPRGVDARVSIKINDDVSGAAGAAGGTHHNTNTGTTTHGAGAGAGAGAGHKPATTYHGRAAAAAATRGMHTPAAPYSDPTASREPNAPIAPPANHLFENSPARTAQWLALDGRCFPLTTTSYVYKFCPYRNVTQRDSHTLHVNLGVFDSWTSGESATSPELHMEFTDGTACSSGALRKTHIKMVCASVTGSGSAAPVLGSAVSADGMELAEPAEPAVCQYKFTFRTPLACVAAPPAAGAAASTHAPAATSAAAGSTHRPAATPAAAAPNRREASVPHSPPRGDDVYERMQNCITILAAALQSQSTATAAAGITAPNDIVLCRPFLTPPPAPTPAPLAAAAAADDNGTSDPIEDNASPDE